MSSGFSTTQFLKGHASFGLWALYGHSVGKCADQAPTPGRNIHKRA
jgi:hypothetical protein